MGVFRNSSSLHLNGYSIYGLCLTWGTNEFLGSYSNYKFIISSSILIRRYLWRILCSQSIHEEVLQFSFSTPISSLWFCNSSSFLSSFSIFIFFKLILGSLLSHIQTMHQKLVHYLLLYIVPEWYFLCQYAMLKAVPNKNAGFIILLTSIFTLFFFGEIRNLTTLCLLNNNSFSLSFFFGTFLSFLWIGAQFPQEKFLSYARILTLYYYFLLMCILFSK